MDWGVGRLQPSDLRRWKKTRQSAAFWRLAALMVAITVLHYLTPQVRILVPSLNAFLSRHAVERIAFVLPVAYATAAFGMLAGLIILALSALIMLPRIIWISPQPLDALFETLMAVGVGYLVIWLIQVQAREKELHRLYARHITQAQEEERLRIARDLHDVTLQTMIVLSRRLEALAAAPLTESESDRRKVDALRELVVEALRDTRRFVRNLRPPVLDHLGPVAAIRGLVNDLEEGGEIRATFEVQGRARRLSPEEELTLFRIAQEALQNVQRHAGASQVTVRLVFAEDRAQMEIEDNGRGLKVPERRGDFVARGKLGLTGMAERAHALGGTVSVRSRQGHGTSISVDLPVQSEQAGS